MMLIQIALQGKSVKGAFGVWTKRISVFVL